ncbi:MAG: CapA family protein [Myxococcales bacterium]|nr:CapA family protein [Myxococcales bacterium]
MAVSRRTLMLSCGAAAMGAAAPRAGAGAPSTPAPAEGAINLWFAGDLHLGEHGREILAPLRDLLPPDSLGYVNLEGPIGAPAEPGATNLEGGPVLVNSPAAAPILRDIGVAVAGVVNNHDFDRCVSGEHLTQRTLRRAGVVAADNAGGLIERGGLRLAFTAHHLDPAPPERLGRDLRRARARADHLIATFHIDGPPSYLPPAELKEAVEIALEAGASAIVCHGSHAIARVESRGDAVIAWGLGNLAFACDCTDEVDAAILCLRLDRRHVLEAAWLPIAAGLRGAPVARHPEPELMFDLLASLRSTPGAVIDDRYYLDLGPFRAGR